MLISANQEESVFADADALDLSRAPNKHLAFASGNHYCLGHHLARLEGRIAITRLLQRFDNLEITVPPEQPATAPHRVATGPGILADASELDERGHRLPASDKRR